MTAPTLDSKDAAFDAWMALNLPDLRAYTKAYADKFHANIERGLTAFQQMEFVRDTGVPMDSARQMVSALLRIYVTGHTR